MSESHRHDVHSEHTSSAYDFDNNLHRAFHSILRCPPELWRNIRQFYTSLQLQAFRVRTLRGIPRMFVLRRAFFLFWTLTVILFVYLKWYFPLYLTSTVSRNSLEEFGRDWCLVRRVSTDWELVSSPCRGMTKFSVSLPGWGLENRTDPAQSYIPIMDIKTAGDFSRFSIQSQTSNGQPKTVGGDDWRVFIWGPTALSPTVIDHENGTYEVLFLISEPGTYHISVVLDYSLCDGMKNPPDYWFMLGMLPW